ncbi:MAG TPA: ROK family transcriptional regulator [Solirubrobacteraceae bacterium]|nr:ROK family transcriptional regulator [Solirubrobacteraceae bacterium]
MARTEYGSLGSLRDHNRRRVVEELQRRGTASRAELARITGLSRSTISSLVGDLQDSGLVVETAQDGDGRAQGQGRPPVLLTLDRRAGAVVGIDFGHAGVHVAVADLSRTILAEGAREMDVDHAGASALDAAAELVRTALDEADVPIERVLAAGMGVSGPVDHEADIVHRTAILPSWGDLRPGAEMHRRLGVPVFIENDANLGAMAEVAMGAAQDVGNAIYIMIAAGIGAGVVVDGSIIHGAGGTAGELGHVLVDDSGPICRCGNRGCLETFAAGPAIVELLRRTHGPDLSFDRVLELVAEDDPGALRAVADAGRAVGRVLAGLVNVLNPEAIVIGGELAAAGDALLDPIRAAIARYAIPSASADVRVVQSPLGGRAEVLGALILAAHRADVPQLHTVPAVP